MRPSNNTASPLTKDNAIRSPSPPDRKLQTPKKPDRFNNYIQEDPPSSEPTPHYPVFFTPLSRMVYKHRSTCSSRDSAQKEREIHFSESIGQANILAQRKQKLSITRQQYQPRRKEYPQQQWKIDMLKQFEDSSKHKSKNEKMIDSDKGIFQKQTKLEDSQSVKHKYPSGLSSSSKLAEFCDSQNFNPERSVQGAQAGSIYENRQEEQSPRELEYFCDLSKNLALRPQNKQPSIGKQLRKEGTLLKKNKSTNQQETLLSDRTHLKCEEQLERKGSPNRQQLQQQQQQQHQEQYVSTSPPIFLGGISKTTSKSTLNFHKLKQPKQANLSGGQQQQSSNSCISSKTSLSIIDLFGSSDFFPLAKSSFCSTNNPDTSRTQGSSKLNPTEKLKETPQNIHNDSSKHATFSSLEEIKNELFHNATQNKTFFKFVSARKVDGYSLSQQNQGIKSGRVRQCIVKRTNSSRERESSPQDHTNNNFDVKSISIRKQDTMQISSGFDESEVLKGKQQLHVVDGVIPTPMSTYIGYSNSCRHQHYVIDQHPGKILQTDGTKTAHLEGNKMNKTKVLIINGDKFINPNSFRDTKTNPLNNLLVSSTILASNDTGNEGQVQNKQNLNGIGLSNEMIDAGIGNATPLSNSINCQFSNNYNFSAAKHSPNSNQNNNTWKHGRSSTLQLNRNGNLKKELFENFSSCQQKLQSKQSQQNQGYLSNRSNEGMIKPRANSNFENKNQYSEELMRNPFNGEEEKMLLGVGVSGFENAEEEETDPAYGIDSYVHDDRHKI